MLGFNVLVFLGIVLGGLFWGGVGYAVWLTIRRQRAELGEATRTSLQHRILDELEQVHMRLDLLSERMAHSERPPTTPALDAGEDGGDSPQT
jgi:hypothetical protein